MSQYNNTTLPENCQVQVDKLLSKLQTKKHYNKTVVDFFESQGLSDRARQVDDCGTQVAFVEQDGVVKFASANFCKNRICHICAWRRQAKFHAITHPILTALEQDYNFLFLTLTVKNCYENAVASTLDNMCKAFDLFRKNRKIEKYFFGFIRSIEITYNPKLKNYHPHIHCLVAVSKSYNKNVSIDFIKALWGRCLRVDYTPVCDIRRVHEDGGKTEVLEVMKYAFKSSKYSEKLYVLWFYLKKRRLVSFTGVFAKTRKLLKLTDDFDNDLTDRVKTGKYTAVIYNFDVTGGIYKFYKSMEVER